MDTVTSRPRHAETVTVTKVTEGSFTVDSGWTFGNQRCPAVKVGDTLLVETIGISRVVGIMDADSGSWYFHDTDEDLERQDREQREAYEASKRAELEEHREEWTQIEAGLPQWIKARIEFFRTKAGERFEIDGWGYELAIAELAVLYAEHGLPTDGAWESEPQEVRDFAERVGTSGNQHGMAKALARMHLAGKDLAGTVSGLSPITGDPYYEKTA